MSLMCVGVAVIDIRSFYDSNFPPADSKVHVRDTLEVAGGNAFVESLIASRVSRAIGASESASVCCCLGSDTHGSLLLDTAQKFHVNTKSVIVRENARTSFAFVVNDAAGTRTAFFQPGAVFDESKDLSTVLQSLDSPPSFFLTDGKFPHFTLSLHEQCPSPHLLIFDAEPNEQFLSVSNRSDHPWWKLFNLANVLIINETGLLKVNESMHSLVVDNERRKLIVCTLGERGSEAILRRSDGELESISCPAHRPTAPIHDTCGAGDSFVGALVACLMKMGEEWTIEQVKKAMRVASFVAAEFITTSELRVPQDDLILSKFNEV